MAEAEVALVGALLLIGIFLAGVLLGVVLTLAFSMFIYAGVDGGRKGWP